MVPFLTDRLLYNISKFEINISLIKRDIGAQSQINIAKYIFNINYIQPAILTSVKQKLFNENRLRRCLLLTKYLFDKNLSFMKVKTFYFICTYIYFIMQPHFIRYVILLQELKLYTCINLFS